MYKGTYKVLSNNIVACDYRFVLQTIQKSILLNKKLLISPIASYTLVAAHLSHTLMNALNEFDLLLPDGQWVRHALFFLYGVKMKERVYGPLLMLKLIKLSAQKRYRIFFYGTDTMTLKKLVVKLKSFAPGIQIAGYEPSPYRQLTSDEKTALMSKINDSMGQIIFIGLGSPFQEIFSHDLIRNVSRPLVVIPVGAAFDFISGTKPQASLLIQKIGFEWLFRFATEPWRLWKRYILYGPLFVLFVLLQKISYVINPEIYHSYGTRGK